MGYITQFLAPDMISTTRDWDVVKLIDLVISDPFVGYSTHFLLRRRYQRLGTPITQKLGRRQNHRFGHSWPFLWAMTHNIWLRGRFQRLVTPGTRKLRRHQNTSIWSFLAVFVGYSTQFLAPDMISTTRDWDVVKLVDLVISGRFRVL